MATVKSKIRIRTQFEGFHHYPNASQQDPRIKFLESTHRHMFHVEVTIDVEHDDREIEFFLAKWALQDWIRAGDQNHQSCEMMARRILNEHLIPNYGADREYTVVVSEDGESDGIIEYTP